MTVKTKRKKMKYTVHLMQPVISWEGVDAYSEEEAITQCQNSLGEYDYDQDAHCEWVVDEEEI